MNQLAGSVTSWRAGIKRHKKILVAAAVFLAVSGIAAASKFKAVQADKTEVVLTDVTSTVVEKGTVTGDERRVFSEVQGTVKAVNVSEGQQVGKGQVMAEIDTGDIDARIAQLEGQLRATEGSEQTAGYLHGQTQVQQQQLAVEQAQIAAELARKAYERMAKLFEEGAVTRAELDRAEADYDTRKKDLEQARFQLKSIQGQNQGNKVQYQGQKESIQAQLEQMQSEKVKSRITAAGDDTIFVRKIKAGDYVTPGTMLFILGRKGGLKIETYVASPDAAYLKNGDEVTVTFKLPGQDASVTGKIERIAPVAETVVSALGISEPKIKISIDLETTPSGITVVPGASVDVTFITQQHRNVLAVPKEAVFSDNGKDFVWLANDGTASIKQIKKGPDGDSLTVIEEGLKKGDLVLMNPHQQDLQPGVRIK